MTAWVPLCSVAGPRALPRIVGALGPQQSRDSLYVAFMALYWRQIMFTSEKNKLRGP
jgi:hypothetical protein